MRRIPASFGLIVALGLASTVNAKPYLISGFSVSSLQVPCHTNTSEIWMFGSIVKYTIVNNVVTQKQTIYDKYWAHEPQINPEGTKIVFIRKDIGGTDTAPSKDVHLYLSVMNADGGNVHELDTFPSLFNQYRGRICRTDWSADYIYYTKEVCNPFASTPCTEVWRVRDNDPSTRSKVGAYDQAATWSISLDAKWASMTNTTGASNGPLLLMSIPHPFPPVSPDPAVLIQGWPNIVTHMCGSYISPSGKFHWHFQDGGHNMVAVNALNPPTGVLYSTTFDLWNYLSSWTGLPGDSIYGGGSEWGHWSNSDKWITGCHPNKPRCYNQILINWVDSFAICTSRNSTLVKGCPVFNSAGDFWLAGGPGGKVYQDVNGDWCDAITHAVVQHGSTNVIDRSRDISIRSTRDANSAVALYNLRGERVGSFHAGSLAQRGDGVRQGTYIMAGKGRAEKMVIGCL